MQALAGAFGSEHAFIATQESASESAGGVGCQHVIVRRRLAKKQPVRRKHLLERVCRDREGGVAENSEQRDHYQTIK